MTISEVVAALEAIRKEYGDVIVMHHDDWDDFLVEEVTVELAHDGSDPIWGKNPTHVVISGNRHLLDCETGELN